MFDGLLPLEGIHGAVRFVTRPAFAAPQFGTIVYADRAVIVALIVRGFGLWEVVPLAPGQDMRPSALERIVPWLSFGIPGFQRLTVSRYGVSGHCPDEISSWEKVRNLAARAPDCRTSTLDGVTYSHYLQDREAVIQASWSNPDRTHHPAQTKLITAYARLFARANLTPIQLGSAAGVDAETPIYEPVAEPFSPESEDDLDRGPKKKRGKPWQRRR